MPSLRRTFSSPSVRSSPYPTFLSSSDNVGSGRLHGHGIRRSSGSETSSRRVLADLEWWRVVDGQRDSDVDQDTEEHYQGQDRNGGAPAGDAPSFVGAEHLSTPLVWTLEGSLDTEINPPTSEFAALSIAPRTPPRSPRRRRMHTGSSSSSLELTPEAVERPLECIRFTLTDSDMGFADVEVPPTLPLFSLACGPATPFLATRTHSFDFSALLNDSAGRFADIGFTSRDHDIFT